MPALVARIQDQRSNRCHARREGDRIAPCFEGGHAILKLTHVRIPEPCVDRVRGHGLTVANGQFGADMKVALVNDGPVTFLLEMGGAE